MSVWWCLHKNLWISVGSQKFQAGEHIHKPAEWFTSAPQGQKLSSSVPVVVHLYPFSYPLIYSKLLNISKFLWVLWTVRTNYLTWGGSCEHPQFIAKSNRSVGILGTCCLWLVFEVEAVFGTEHLNPRNLILTPVDRVKIELNCRIPSQCLQKTG